MSEVKTIIAADLPENPEPLVRYRKKDELRRRQLEDMHDTVAGKVDDVIASFQSAPSRVQQFDEIIVRRARSKRREDKSENDKESRIEWMFYLLAGIGMGMVIFGWSKLA